MGYSMTTSRCLEVLAPFFFTMRRRRKILHREYHPRGKRRRGVSFFCAHALKMPIGLCTGVKLSKGTKGGGMKKSLGHPKSVCAQLFCCLRDCRHMGDVRLLSPLSPAPKRVANQQAAHTFGDTALTFPRLSFAPFGGSRAVSRCVRAFFFFKTGAGATLTRKGEAHGVCCARRGLRESRF